EGLPDSQRNPKPTPQRKRPSKRCDCRWRVVLSENENGQWEFRKSLNPNASEHNHEMMSPEEMVKAWPTEVNDMIIYLAQQRLQTHEIRESVRQRFPDITWNERRFYNRLTEERKRIRQRSTVERTRRLLLLSSQLCAVIAGNDEWAQCVENDLHRMFENYCQLSRITPELLTTLVDLQPDLIQSDTEKLTSTAHRLSIHSTNNANNNSNNTINGMEELNDSNNHNEDDKDYNHPHIHPLHQQDQLLTSPMKKRKSSLHSKQLILDHTSSSPSSSSSTCSSSLLVSSPKGSQAIFIPSFTMYARSQSFRSCSDASSQGSRRTRDSSSTTTGLESPTNTVSSFMGHNNNHSNSNNNNNGLFALASPTSSSSSSSSSMPYRQQPFRLDIPHHQQSLTSPQQQNLTSPVDAASHFMLPHTSHPEQQQTYAINDLSYNHPHHSNAMQQQQQQQQPSFSTFPSFSSPTNDITFNLEHHHPHSSTTTATSMSTTATAAHDHDHHRSSSSSIYSYYPHIKEEPIYDDRSYSTTSSTATNYNNLPMIRTNDHSDNLPPMVTNTTEVNPVTATGFY
ncbi:hypothetical protein BJ944DRAFT_244938, partial [Cunninghamella echinulata]